MNHRLFRSCIGLFILAALAAVFVPVMIPVGQTMPNATAHILPFPDLNRSADGNSTLSPGAVVAITPGLPGIMADTGENITGTSTPPFTNHPSVRDSRPAEPVISVKSLEACIHERVNRVRQEHLLPPLDTDTALASLARAHSADMASNRYFGHVNLQEHDATARGSAVGITCNKAPDTYYTSAISENLYATWLDDPARTVNSGTLLSGGSTEEAIAQETVDAWMNSPDHRDTVLDRGLQREGIGVALAAYDLVFVTEDLC